MPGYDVVVVGGGVAGLIAGLRHAESGCRTVVLEANGEPGGCVRRHEVGGLMLDRGAESFATSRPEVARLIEELGLAVQQPAGGPAWVRHPGGQAPIPAATLLGIPAWPAAADVRRVIGWAGVARAELDRALPRGRSLSAPAGGPPPGLGALVRRRMGRRVLTRLVQPVAGGVYSIDPDELDIASVAPDLAARLVGGRSLAGAVAAARGRGPAAGSAVRGIVGGMGLLTEALTARFLAAGGVLRCGVQVRSITRDGQEWRLSAATGPDAAEDRTAPVEKPTPPGEKPTAPGEKPTAPGERSTAPGEKLSAPVDEFTAAGVVLAVPGAVADSLIAGATNGDVRLPVAPASRVRLVTLVLDAPALDGAPRGSGLLVAPGVTDVAAKALTHATAKWRWLAELAGPHRHVLRLSYGRGDEARSFGPENARSAESQTVAARGDRNSADGDGSEIQDSVDETGCGVIDVALRDASRLMGVPLSRSELHAHAVVDFAGQLAASRAAQAAERARFQQQIAAIAGLSVVGAAIAGTGLSAVVANATAAPLVASGRNSAGSKHDES